ncbi:MAG: Trk family potassium uptake protein [Halobacteriovoraceae bacterium]|nr:Trk family potassium uptake protein [Halobacteriovoraceae bacterium]
MDGNWFTIEAMNTLWQKIPFLLELFINGTFILFYSLRSMDKIPMKWSPELVENIIFYGARAVPVVIIIHLIVQFTYSKSIEYFFRKYIFSLTIFVPLVITWGDDVFAWWLSSAHLLSSVLSVYDDDSKLEEKSNRLKKGVFDNFKLKPAQLVILSFSAVILFGTFFLMLPFASQNSESMGFIDALFMATSATCVTGLSTKSLASEFTLFGQIVILVLIQIGGLSIMTLYSSMTILLGRSLGMKDRVIMQDLLDVSSLEDLFVMIIDIVKYTFIIELWGAIVLTIAFTFEGFEFGQALYYGFFHSISAFCNAGFALFDTSLESYAVNPLITGTIMILITLGGLGFVVLKELKEIVTTGKKLVRLGLHAKIVLVTSMVLTIVGAVFIFFGEFLHALDNYTLFEKIQVALFQSVTLRTAGFNSIPLTGLHTYTLYAMTLFMFIGGSPGSTAGGVKTTTLAILVQSITSTLKGEKRVTILDRTIPAPIVVRVIALMFISIIITSTFILILMKFEPNQSFLAIFFEVISASGTVGLSLGITPFLTVAGKIGIAILMFIGRIGPLTLILGIGQQDSSKGSHEYPDGRIMIG